MKKVLLFGLMISAMFVLASCGSKSNSNLTPTSKKINGPLGKFFEVVERDYKIIDNELSVEFKRIAEGGPVDASWSTKPTFTVEIQDEDGNSLGSEHTDVVFTREQLEAVFSLGVDETASITFKFDKDKIKDAAKFKVTSKWDDVVQEEAVAVEEENSDSDTSSSDNFSSSADEDLGNSIDEVEEDNDGLTSNRSSSSSSEDWNAVLTSYERYVDKYISYMKKAKAGDVSALAEYASLLEEAQDLSNKLQNASDELSPSQLARYQRITTKMLNAAR